MSAVPSANGTVNWTTVALAQVNANGGVAPIVGSSIYVAVEIDGTATVTSVSDDAGNSYQAISADATSTTATLYTFAAINSNGLGSGIAGGGSNVYLTFSVACSGCACVVSDNASVGLDPNVTIASHGTGGTAAPAWATLSQAEENIVVVLVVNGNTPQTTPAGFTFLTDTSDPAAATGISVWYKAVTATTAGSASVTIAPAGRTWSAAVLAGEVQPITIATPLSCGITTEAYSQVLAASGGSGSGYTYALSGSLPPGLSLATATISGTPTRAGVYSFTINVTDSSGITTGTAMSITVIAGGASGASALGVIPANLISKADSDSESSTGYTWSNFFTAGSVGRTSAISLTGGFCTSFTRLNATSAPVVSAGFYPAQPNQSYIVGSIVLPTSGQLAQIQLGAQFYDGNHSAIGTPVYGSATFTPAGYGIWQPCYASIQSPAGCVYMKVVVSDATATGNIGDTYHLDSTWIEPMGAQVLVDFVNPAFSVNSVAGDNFLDISPWVDVINTPISVKRGRQDSVTEMVQANVSFSVLNDAGLFTENPAAENLITALGGSVQQGCRLQINFIDPNNGVWATRFDGPLTNFDYDTTDGTGNTAWVTVSASDVLSYLTNQPNMLTWTQGTVLLDTPWYHWPLDDAGAASGAAGGAAREASGNGHAALHTANDDSSGLSTIAWADTTGGVETQADATGPGLNDGSSGWSEGSYLPNSLVRGPNTGATGPFQAPVGAVLLTPNQTVGVNTNNFVNNEGYYLTGKLDQVLSPSDTWDCELYFTVSPTVRTSNLANSKAGPWVQLSLNASRSGHTLLAGIFQNGSGGANYLVGRYASTPAFATKNFSITAAAPVADVLQSWTPDSTLVPHHLVLSNNAGTITAYLDSVAIGTFALDLRGIFDTIAVGAAVGGGAAHAGHVSMCQIYHYNMSQEQILTHCQNGLYGNFEQTTDTSISQLAARANIPSFWDNTDNTGGQGLSVTDYYDISQQNPLTNMQIFEQTERGLLFVNSAGQLTFHTRDWRMGYNGPDQYLPPDTFEADMQLKLTNQFMQNAVTVTSTAFTSGGSYLNTPSVAQFGPYFSNYTSAQAASQSTPNSVVLPLYAWNRAGAQLGLTGYQFHSDPNFDSYAAWTASIYGIPWQVPGQVSIDLLTVDPVKVTVTQLYALDIDNMIAPSGTLPVSFPGGLNEWFIEGIDETYAIDGRQLQLMCTPAATQRAWGLGDTTYGALGTTSRIGISAPSSDIVEAWGKDVAHDTGRPYWAPDLTNLAGNVALNGDFGTGDLTGWSTFNVTSAFQNNPPPGCPKKYAVLLSSPSSGNLFLQTTFVIPQKQYTQGVWAYSPLGGTFSLAVQEYGAMNSVFEDQLGSGTLTVTAGTWQYFEFNPTGTYSPAGTTTQDVAWRWGVQLGSGSNPIYFSDFQLAPGLAGLNNPAANGHNFVGDMEMRGILDSLSIKLNPPMLCVGQISNVQSYSTGAAATAMAWDQVFVDTEGGMGLLPGFPQWYVVTRPGFYDIDAAGVLAGTAANGLAGQASIIVAKQAAQAVANGTGNPNTVTQYISPLGEAQRFTTVTTTPIVSNPSVRMYLGLGDAVALWAQQDTGGTINTSNSLGGSKLSLVWQGYSTSGDNCEINSKPGLGGTVNSIAIPHYYKVTFTNTHTFAFDGFFGNWKRVNSDGAVLQGVPKKNGFNTGAQLSQIVFNTAAMRLKIANAGGIVTRAKLEGYLQNSRLVWGTEAQVGSTTASPGAGLFNASSTPGAYAVKRIRFDGWKQNVIHPRVKAGGDIPISIVNRLLSSDTCIVFGDGNASKRKFNGSWQGGPNSWRLTVHYKVIS